MIEAEFLRVSAVQMETMFGRIETCVAKLTPEQVWARQSENENAVGNLLLHLTGNVRQWIIAGLGGELDRRQRDEEFDQREGVDGAALVAGLRRVVEAAAAVIRGLPEGSLMERVTIQKRDVTKVEAVYHVVEHFTGHTFQIIFATKLLTSEDLGFHAYLRTR